MGMRESSICLFQELSVEDLSKDARVTPEEFQRGIEQRIMTTSFLANNERELSIDHTIAKMAVKVSARRHAGKLEYTYYGNCDLVQRGKDLTEIQTVIGTGGPIVNSAHPKEILSQVEKQSKKEDNILLPKKIEAYIDKEYVFFAAGLLRAYDEEAALTIMKKSIQKI